LAALTVKEATEIKNSARGLELRRHGADEQCLRTEGEVATCSTVDQRRGGVLAAERCDGRRSTAFDRSAGEWGGGSDWACGEEEEEGGPVGVPLS
jgi:hypothetical protein